MTLISDYLSLKNFCYPLLESQQPLTIAIDMEFMREATYRPILCLIQIATSLASLPPVVLIDPLEGLDLSPLKEILLAPHLIKVFHSGRQDLEICWHQWQALPVNFLDTQIAAMVCGLGEGIGYNTLVHNLLDVTIAKDSQHTNWLSRPLASEQISYAQGDVLHLLKIFFLMREKLTFLNRWEWMEDDIKVLLDPLTYQPNPCNAWQKIYSFRKKEVNLAVLQDMTAWRERTAISLDINRRRILQDETLWKFAETRPATDEAIDRLLEASEAQATRRPVKKHIWSFSSASLRKEIISIYKAALQKPHNCWPAIPEKPRLTLQEKQHLAALKVKIREIAQTLNVPGRLIAPAHAMVNLVKGNTVDNPMLHGWRYNILTAYEFPFMQA